MRDAPAWIPSPLLELGPAGLAWWQWLGLAVFAVAAFIVGRLIAAIARGAVGRIVARSAATWDDQLLHRLDGPLRWLAAVGLMRVALPLLALEPAPHVFVTGVLLGLLGVGLVWILFGVVDVMVGHAAAAPWASARPASRALVLLGGRVVKVIVLAIGLIAFLSGLGVPVASLVAGLGIGGIALAFGAQKTVENLFGAFALGVDQPLREGDFVRIEDQALGTVEAVGLRSTRIRTLDRTVVSLPNGRLADMRIETFAPRDRCRMHATLGVVYATTQTQLATVLAGLERVLRDHPGIWPDDVIVRFVGFGASSLDIEVMAWFETGDFGQFRTWRQEVLLGFMGVVEEARTSFAFPTRTIHVESLPSPTAAVDGSP
jgi:MscS family membrane protein